MVSQGGYLAQDDLLKWLKASREKATGTAPESLATDAPLVAGDVPELIEALQSARSAQREAAIGRLVASPQLAAREVAKSLREKKLRAALGTGTVNSVESPGRSAGSLAARDLDDRAAADGRSLGRTDRDGNGRGRAGFSPVQVAAAAREIDRLAEANDAEAAHWWNGWDILANRSPRRWPRGSRTRRRTACGSGC